MPVPPRVSVEPAKLAVTPGDTAVARLRIANEGPGDERYHFEVLGEAALWASVSPFAVTVAPGDEGTTQVLLRPSRSPSPEAGIHPVTIRIRPTRGATGEFEATLEAAVGVHSEMRAALDPVDPGAAPGVDRHVTIDNRGNAARRAEVTATDPGGRMTIAATPSVVDLRPGGRATVALALGGTRPLLASADERPYAVTVDPEGGPPIVLAGAARMAPIVSPRALVAAAVVVAVALIVVGLRSVLSSSPSSSSTAAAAHSVVPASANCPAAGHLAHDANGQVRQNVIEPDNFSFLFLAPGGCSPIRWNPCAPIHYMVNGTLASPAQIADTHQAAADIAAATGIDFVDDGPTTDQATARRNFDPPVVGNHWAPVLIDWTHLGGATSLTETAGGGVPIESQGVYVSGVVVLNVDAHLAQNAPLPTGFGSGVTWGRILLHELGHVVGLGHVSGVEQIMHDPVTEQTSPTSAYGFGDLTGLRLLGKAAGCLTTPPVPAAAH